MPHRKEFTDKKKLPPSAKMNLWCKMHAATVPGVPECKSVRPVNEATIGRQHAKPPLVQIRRVRDPSELLSGVGWNGWVAPKECDIPLVVEGHCDGTKQRLTFLTDDPRMVDGKCGSCASKKG